MRIAALAFGVIAGLIASLILALGGLEITVAATGAAADRQLQLWRFGLFVIANLGVLGAGVVLASPLGGAILFAIGAIAWVVAAVMLRHGPDLVLVTPPMLLLVATGLATFAFLRRQDNMPSAIEPMRVSMSSKTGPEDATEMPATRVNAGFLGDAGSAAPMRGTADREPALGPADSGTARSAGTDWTPGRRRPPPPRTRQVFRPVDDEFEETGFSRLARGVSSILSFGLYAGLAAAVVLVFWNLRSIEAGRPAVAKLEPAATSSAAAPAPASKVDIADSTAKPAPKPSAKPQPSSERLATEGGLAFDANQPIADAQPTLQRPRLAGVVVQSDPAPAPALTPPAKPQQPASAEAAAADEPAADTGEATDTPAADGAAPVMPFPMSTEMAAQRTGKAPAPKVTTQRRAAPIQDIGL